MNSILNPLQKEIVKQLKTTSPLAVDTYKGGIFSMQNEYPDNLAQSAHSLREVISLLIREEDVTKEKEDEKDKSSIRRKKLRKALDIRSDIKLRNTVYESPYKILFEYYGWFSGVAHHGNFPTLEEYKEHVTNLEKLLNMYILPTEIDRHKRMKTLLDTEKTVGNVELLSLSIMTASSYEFFFSNINEDWLDFLEKANCFKELPTFIKDEGGYVFEKWPEGEYLKRMAVKQPDKVNRILKNINTKGNDNIYVREVILSIGCIFIANKYDCKAIINKFLKDKWIETPYHPYWTNALLNFITKLIEFNKYEELCSLLQGIIKVRELPNAANSYDSTKSLLPEYDIQTFLNQIPFAEIPNNYQLKLLQKLVFILGDILAIKYKNDHTSSLWRNTIEDGYMNQGYYDSLENILIDKIRDWLDLIGDSLSRKDFNTIFSDKRVYSIYDRIKIYFYTRHPSKFWKDINTIIIDKFDDFEIFHEYQLLLEPLYPQLDEETKQIYLDKVDTLYTPDYILNYKKSLKAYNKEITFQEIEEKTQSFINEGKAVKLSKIRNYLTEKDKERFKDALVFNIEGWHTDLHYWVSPAYRIDPQKKNINSFAIKQIPDYLLSTLDSKNEYGESVVQDMGIELFEDSKKRANEYLEHLSAFSPTTQHINYISAILSGVLAYSQTDNVIPWKETIQFFTDILNQYQLVKGSIDKRTKSLWDSTFSDILQIIELGIRSTTNSIPLNLYTRIFNLVNSLLLEDDISSEEESKLLENNSPHSLSLTQTKGMALRLVFMMYYWLCKDFKQTEQRDKRLNTLEEIILGFILNSYSLSILSVIGHHILTVHYNNAAIFRKSMDLFAKLDQKHKEAFAQGYVLNQLYVKGFKDASVMYIFAITHIQNHKANWYKHYVDCLIGHLSNAYLLNIDKNKPSLFIQFLQKNITYQSRAIEYTGRFMTPVVTMEPGLSMMKKLWSTILKPSTLDSKKTFKMFGYWITKGSNLEIEWKLRNLKKTLQLTDGDIENEDYLLDFLLENKQYINLCLDCLNLMLKQNKVAFMYNLETIKKIIEEGEKGTAVSIKKSMQARNSLVQLGYTDFSTI